MQLFYETPRLILKVLKADNANASSVLNFYLHDQELFEKYEPDRAPNYYTASFQKTVLKYEYNLTVKGEHIRYYIFLKEAPTQPIGTVCFHDIDKTYYSCCEIGYKLSAQYQHQGYAKEALNYALAALFEEGEIHRVNAWVDITNEPSIKLLTKVGFEQEGVCKDFVRFHGKWRDHIQFCMINPFH